MEFNFNEIKGQNILKSAENFKNNFFLNRFDVGNLELGYPFIDVFSEWLHILAKNSIDQFDYTFPYLMI